MKALTVAQPWAALIAHGHKKMETRPAPPNGPMRPEGVRGLPGLAIDRGERIAIHAAAGLPDVFDPAIRGGWMYLHRATGEQVIRNAETGETIAAPLGAAVATAVVTDALPIVSGDAWMWSDLPLVAVTDMRPPHYKSCHPYPALVRFTAPDETGVDVSDELPLGDYTPGRWAWVLDDVQPLAEPIPCKGAQGVWRLPADVAESSS